MENPKTVMVPIDSNGLTPRGNKLSYGIEHNPDDVEDVKGYWINEKYVKADEIIHIKILADTDQKRGVPYMEAVMEDIRNYRNWLRDRIVLNKIRTAIALIRKIPPGVGTPTQIGAVRDQGLASVRNIKSNKLQTFEPGTILTTKGIEYEFLSPNLDAQDSAHDGRHILLSIAAGVGMPEYMITADSSNANYSSTMVSESPAVREFQDWQDYFEFYFKQMFKEQMELAIQAKFIRPTTDPTCETEFPSLVMRDIQKEARAFQLMREKGVISIKTWRGRADLDDEIEQENIRTELESDYPMPPGMKSLNKDKDEEEDPEDDKKEKPKPKKEKEELNEEEGESGLDLSSV